MFLQWFLSWLCSLTAFAVFIGVEDALKLHPSVLVNCALAGALGGFCGWLARKRK